MISNSILLILLGITKKRGVKGQLLRENEGVRITKNHCDRS